MIRYSVEHTLGSIVMSGIALLLVALSYVSSNIVPGVAAIVFVLWSLSFIRVRADKIG